MVYQPRSRCCARCSTRLALDNSDRFCAACRSKASDELVKPPTLARAFWVHDHLREALDSWHFGRLIAAYRSHPHHGRVLTQETVAGWLNLTQAQLSRIEGGRPPEELSKLSHWAVTLGVPGDLLWFKLPHEKPRRAQHHAEGATAQRSLGAAHRAAPGTPDVALEPSSVPMFRYKPLSYPQETAALPRLHPTPDDLDAVDDDMNRRALLRLLSTAGALMAMPELHAADSTRPVPEAVADYEQLNPHLWQAFALSKSKRAVYPLVRQQLSLLTTTLQQPHGTATHQRLCALAGDLLQLAGEVFFDSNRYTDAAHCYTLAADAGKEARAYDLWACALTRHAFVGMHERRFADVAAMLDAASAVARRGDHQLSTRYWVAAVQAQAFAGLGDLDACNRALDRADAVQSLTGQPHNGGWLRFDGSRLAEERGSCYVSLERPDLAETALTNALSQKLSPRRRGSVLTDLAQLGVQRRDPDQVLTHGTAALELAAHTGSGYVSSKLQALKNQLAPMAGDRRVQALSDRITALA